MILHRPDFRMLCVDPGLRGCGVAEFLGGTLVRAAYVKNPLPGRGYETCRALGPAVFNWARGYINAPLLNLVIIEHPRFYGSVHQKGDPNDTLDCGIVGSAVATAFDDDAITSVFPSDWKGQVKKPIMLERIRKAIHPDERPKIQPNNKSDMEDVLDAIGIGFWKLGRLNKKVIHND